MSEIQAPVSTETAPASTPAPETQTPAQPSTPTPAPTQGLSTPDAPASKGLDFIPEQFKSASWATKYKTPEDFFKGVEGMAQLIGKKEIVNIQGVQPPKEDAPDEEFHNFYKQIGTPETADKYALPEDIKAPEGYDIAGVKKNFSELAHQAGLTQKQASKLFKSFIEKDTEGFKQSEESRVKTFEEATKKAFPDDLKTGLAMAKKGAKALGIADTLDQEGLSLIPTVLKLCAKLGELAGEDSFVKSTDVDSKESLIEEAMRIQKSPEYMSGDKAAYRKVQDIYTKVYDKK